MFPGAKTVFKAEDHEECMKFNFPSDSYSKSDEVNISVSESFLILPIRSSHSASGGILDEKKNEVSCHDIVTDAVVSSMQSRFSSHEKLYKQISCFDRNRFS